jgi:hypothetical protein
MYKEDFAAARTVLPEEPDYSALLQGLAFRFATVRELSTLASSAPKLRAELQAANEEVASLRELYKTLHASYESVSKARDANAESSVMAWKDLDAIRDRLTSDGFAGVNVVTSVETVLESLREAQKERDASASKLDEIQTLLVNTGFVADSAPSPKFAVHGVTWLLEALTETQKERDKANACVEAWQKEGAEVRAALGLALRDDPASACRLLKTELKETRSKLGLAQGDLIDRTAAMTTLETEGFTGCGSIQDGVNRLLITWRKTMNERDEAIEQRRKARMKIAAMLELLDGNHSDIVDPDIEKLADLIEQRAELQAEINSMGAVLNDAKKWATYDFEINSHGRRMDVIRSLAARAEALHGVQDALAKTDIDPTTHPANAIGILTERIATAQGIAEEYLASATMLQTTVEQVQRALDAANAPQSTSLADRIGAFAMQAERWRVDLGAVQDELEAVMKALGLYGKTADQAGDAAKIAQERDALKSKLVATQNVLHIANDLLAAANESLRRALSLPLKAEAVADVSFIMNALLDLIDFWRRGAEPFRQAATKLDETLRSAFGVSYPLFLVVAQEQRRKQSTSP